MNVLRWVAGPPPIRRTSLPGGRRTVRALIEAGELRAGDILACLEHLAEVLPDGRVRLPHRPFNSLSGAAGWVLGCSANGWIWWRCVRDGELLHTKRDRWMRDAAA